MKEIEVKILEINVDEVRKKLLELGATKKFEGEVNAIHFDFDDGRLKANDQTLRVRTVGEQVEFCYKGKNESSRFKSKEEIEVNTNNFSDTMLILDKLGFKKIHSMKKTRESYEFGTIKFEIDTYPSIPTFLEIEAPTENDVLETVKRLGFSEEDMNNLTAQELLKKYETT